MENFSKRKGIEKTLTTLQKEGMNDELKNSVGNIFYIYIIEGLEFFETYPRTDEINYFFNSLFLHFLRKPIDEIPDNQHRKADFLKELFLNFKWNRVYDFFEWLSNHIKNSYYLKRRHQNFTDLVNSYLSRELAGYRLIDDNFVDITDQQEIEMLGEALKDDSFEGVTKHLKRALELLADRENPDYRNSIKESISAVESICQIITQKSKAKLGDALKILEQDHKLHPALKRGFSSLYGYTSNEGGIRHAMLDEPDLDSADAKYFLLSCTSFTNYLKSKI